MTNHDEGTHGVLTNSNSGVTIPVTVDAIHEDYLEARIDGVKTTANVFDFEDGWTFKADLVLPAEAGSVVRVDGTSNWMLLRNGAWFSQTQNAKTVHEFRTFLERNDFAIEVIA